MACKCWMHPFPNFNGRLIKPPLKLEPGLVITPNQLKVTMPLTVRFLRHEHIRSSPAIIVIMWDKHFPPEKIPADRSGEICINIILGQPPPWAILFIYFYVRHLAGNRWGVEPLTGRQGMGLGAQEQFYGCSDVAITQSGLPLPTVRPPTTTNSPTTTARPTTRTTTRSTPRPRTTTTPPVTDRTTRKPRSSTTLLPRSSVRPTPKSTTTVPKYTSHPNMKCKAIGSWEGSPSQDRWCNNNCQIGNCPPDFCHCDVTMTSTVRPASTVAPGDKKTCRSKGDWPNKDSMGRWCARNCPMNNCPEDVCECV